MIGTRSWVPRLPRPHLINEIMAMWFVRKLMCCLPYGGCFRSVPTPAGRLLALDLQQSNGAQDPRLGGVMTSGFVLLSHSFPFHCSLSDGVLESSAIWVGPSMSATRPATSRVSTRSKNKHTPAVDGMRFSFGMPLVIRHSISSCLTGNFNSLSISFPFFNLMAWKYTSLI